MKMDASTDAKTDAGQAGETPATEAGIVLCGDLAPGRLEGLLEEFGLTVAWVAEVAAIPGSYWGDSEAGIIGNVLYVRGDTPVHSALHEASHLVCMGTARRALAHTDAGGEELEESAVCYLQIVLAQSLPEVGSARLMRDMDAWGYSFRLGSTARWFREDAEDARRWLLSRDLPCGEQPTARGGERERID
jgi:hypothetical protein